MKTRYRRTPASQYLVVGIAVLAVIGLGFLSGWVMGRIPFEDYFVLPWSAGRAWLLEGLSPYAPEVSDIAGEALARSPYLAQLPAQSALTEPIVNLFFYLPFSLIPYAISRPIWVALSATLLGLTGYLAIQVSGWRLRLAEKMPLMAFLILWTPGIITLLTGRLSPVITALLLGGLVALLNGQDTLAGFLLSLTFGSLLTSFFVLILVMVISISQRRWSVLTAFFAGIAFLLVVSLLLQPTWILDWIGVLLETLQGWTWVHTPLMTVAQLLPGIEDYFSIALHAGFGIFLIALVITAWGATGRTLSWKMTVLLVLAYLFHPRASFAHLPLLAPAILMIFRYWEERWGFLGTVAAWAFLLGTMAISWIVFAPAFSFINTSGLDVLMIGLPLLVFVGMVWIRWWALTIPRLPYERDTDQGKFTG